MEIELRTFTADDTNRLASWITTQQALEQWAGLFFKHPLDEDQLARYAESGEDPNSQRRIYKAVDGESGDVVGHIELSHIWPHLSARMSRVLVGDPALRRQGIGSKMVRQLATDAFSELSLHRIDAGVVEENRAAIECYRNAGFQHVGTWPNAMRSDIGVINVYWMTLFREPQTSSAPQA